MQASTGNGLLLISVSFIISLALMIIPLPAWAEYCRPEWVFLTLIYWSTFTPKRVSIGIGWIVGLLLDVLQGTLLGEYALMGALTAFVCHQLQQRLQMFPVIQQCVFVFLLLGIQFIMIIWIQGFSGHPIQGWQFGLPVITSTLLWPVVREILHWARRRYRIK